MIFNFSWTYRKNFKLIAMLQINDIKKQLLKSKVDAVFSHYCAGNIYYTVELEDGIYQFPIATVEYNQDGSTFTVGQCSLSSDLGTTSFYREMKGSELNRWIAKAVEKEEFTKIS
jgi:hypothetical protein